MAFLWRGGQVGRPGIRRSLVAAGLACALAVAGIGAAVAASGDDSGNGTGLAYGSANGGPQNLKKGDQIRAKFRNDHDDAGLQACLTVVFFEEDVIGDPDGEPAAIQPDACSGVVDTGDEDVAALTALQDGDHFILVVALKNERGDELNSASYEMWSKDDVEICLRATGDADDGPPGLEQC